MHLGKELAKRWTLLREGELVLRLVQFMREFLRMRNLTSLLTVGNITW